MKLRLSVPKMTKIKSIHSLNFRTHSRVRSEIKAATARSLKGDDAKGHSVAEPVSKGKSFGLANAKNQDYNKSRGLALGHKKGKAAGKGVANGMGHGNGRGGSHGRGHK